MACVFDEDGPPTNRQGTQKDRAKRIKLMHYRLEIRGSARAPPLDKEIDYDGYSLCRETNRHNSTDGNRTLHAFSQSQPDSTYSHRVHSHWWRLVSIDDWTRFLGVLSFSKSVFTDRLRTSLVVSHVRTFTQIAIRARFNFGFRVPFKFVKTIIHSLLDFIVALPSLTSSPPPLQSQKYGFRASQGSGETPIKRGWILGQQRSMFRRCLARQIAVKWPWRYSPLASRNRTGLTGLLVGGIQGIGPESGQWGERAATLPLPWRVSNNLYISYGFTFC